MRDIGLAIFFIHQEGIAPSGAEGAGRKASMPEPHIIAVLRNPWTGAIGTAREVE
jgi:hypothetical protein